MFRNNIAKKIMLNKEHDHILNFIEIISISTVLMIMLGLIYIGIVLDCVWY